MLVGFCFVPAVVLLRWRLFVGLGFTFFAGKELHDFGVGEILFDFEFDEGEDLERGKGDDEGVLAVETDVFFVDYWVRHEAAVADWEDGFAVSVRFRSHEQRTEIYFFDPFLRHLQLHQSLVASSSCFVPFKHLGNFC